MGAALWRLMLWDLHFTGLTYDLFGIPWWIEDIWLLGLQLLEFTGLTYEVGVFDTQLWNTDTCLFGLHLFDFTTLTFKDELGTGVTRETGRTFDLQTETTLLLQAL